MFWSHYRRTAPFIQLAILALAALLYYRDHYRVIQIVIVVAVLEICSVLGALWAVRLKRKLGPSDGVSIRRSEF